MLKRNRKIKFQQPLQVTAMDGDLNQIMTTPLTQGMIIPFSTGGANTAVNLTTDSNGSSTNIIIAAFRNNAIATANSISISNFAFTQTTALYNSFIMPCDAYLDSIHMVAISYNGFTPTTNIRPYVALATAPKESFNFTFNPYIKAVATPFPSGAPVVAGAVNSGLSTKKGFFLPKGTRVAIICGIDADSGTTSQIFNFSGSLYLSSEL